MRDSIIFLLLLLFFNLNQVAEAAMLQILIEEYWHCLQVDLLGINLLTMANKIQNIQGRFGKIKMAL